MHDFKQLISPIDTSWLTEQKKYARDSGSCSNWRYNANRPITFSKPHWAEPLLYLRCMVTTGNKFRLNSNCYNCILGVFKENFLKDILSSRFLSNFTQNTEEINKWQSNYGKSANASLREFILEYVGKPIANLFRLVTTKS